jgi:hypothetical protein
MNPETHGMRILFTLLALPLLILPAYAATTPNSRPTTHTRLTMEQRYSQANDTHDGHLTEDQAKAGYRSIVRHFAAIDKDKKGYITLDDIRAYNKLRRTLHHHAAATPAKG